MWLLLLGLFAVMLIAGLLFRRFIPKKDVEFDPKVQQARDQAQDEVYRNPPPPGML